MNRIFYFMIFISFVFSESNSEEISFQYGLLLNPKSNPDTIFALEDSSIIFTGDRIRLNVAYLPRTYFYFYFLGTDQTFIELYSGYKSEGDTLYYDTAMNWQGFVDPTGLEQFYIINSLNKLHELENTFKRYTNSKGRFKLKLGNSIQTILDTLDPKFEDITAFISRLEKPISGGVTFRGDDNNLLRELDVTHTSFGSGGVALHKITLIHK